MSDDTRAPNGAADFFVSYTQSDRPWAEWIAWELEDTGYRVTIQAWDFAAGRNFVIEMDRATRGAAHTIAVLSPAYQDSAFPEPEWTAAVATDPTGKSRRLLPVRVAECSPVGLLAAIAFIDLVDCDEETARARLLDGVAGVRGKPSERPAFPSATRAETAAVRPLFPARPQVWKLPARNRNFTGRQEWLTQLATDLTSGKPSVVTQAIAGLGGIGKSQLAIEYAYRHAAHFSLVWWVRAETEETRTADLLDLAQAIHLPAPEGLQVSTRLGLLRSWLEQHQGWLLLFDNVESPEDIREVMPGSGSGQIIVTSRFRAWGEVASVLNLGVWSQAEAAAYLMQRTAQRDETSAATLAEALGCLPLAVEQAAAYIDEAGIGLDRYLALFRRSGVQLLRAQGSKATVATVWSLSLKEVSKRSPDAVALLRLLAFLPPDHFSRRRLDRPAPAAVAPLNRILGDEFALNAAIAVLRRYSLIDATQESISVHRLVQVVVQEQLSNAEVRALATTAHNLQFGGDDLVQESEARETERRATSPQSGGRRRRSIVLLSVSTAVLVLAGAGTWVWWNRSVVAGPELPRAGVAPEGPCQYVFVAPLTSHQDDFPDDGAEHYAYFDFDGVTGRTETDVPAAVILRNVPASSTHVLRFGVRSRIADDVELFAKYEATVATTAAKYYRIVAPPPNWIAREPQRGLRAIELSDSEGVGFIKAHGMALPGCNMLSQNITFSAGSGPARDKRPGRP